MDKTLDQLIKERKIGFRGRGTARGANRRGNSSNRGFRGRGFNRGQSFSRGRGQFRPQRSFNGRGFRGQMRQNYGLQRGFQNRGRGFSGRGRPMSGRGGTFNRPMSFNRGRRNYFGVQRGGIMKRQTGVFGGARQMTSNVPVKLYISNLDFGVTNEDIKELFTEFGRVRRYGVNFAQNGQSLGTAEVQYENRNSALKAIQKYNNVPLDGRPMKLAVSGSPADGVPSASISQQRMQPIANNFPRVGRGVSKKLVQRSKMTLMRGRGGAVANRNARGSFSRGGRGGMLRGRRGNVRPRGGTTGRGRGGKKATPTQEQLDADLDAFTAKND